MPSKRPASWHAVWRRFRNEPSAPTAAACWGSGRVTSPMRCAPSISVASRCSSQVRLGKGPDGLPEAAVATASSCLDNYCLGNYRGAMVAEDVERSAAADDGDSIAALVFLTAREVRTALQRKLSSHGVTAQQATLARLLRAWQRKKKPSPFQIAARLGTDGAGMTRLIDRLEAKGVVVRQVGGGDRRVISVELPAPGLAGRKKTNPSVLSVNPQQLHGFDTTKAYAVT